MHYKITLRIAIVFILFIFSISEVSAQVVQKIGSNSFTINPKAVLELESTTKGFLPPRMTTAQQTAISLGSNEKGLIIYVTDTPSPGLQIWDGNKWITFADTAALSLKADTTSLTAEVNRATAAEAAASTDATTKANAAQAAAILAAAADATTKANAAQATATTAASTDAATKATAAQVAAIAAASTDATTKADAAQAAAILAAAADATTKADAAQAASIAAASTDSTTKANAAQAAAIAAASTDATTKANAAQEAASTDATAKVLIETNRATAAEVKLTADKENTANKSTSITLASNSDIKFPTEKAVIDYVNIKTSIISIVKKTSNYTILDSDTTILCDTSGGTFKLTLPQVSGASGKIYVIRKTDMSNIELTFDALTFADGVTVTSLNYPKTLRVQSNGTAWYIID
jgi:hypothetical protein